MSSLSLQIKLCFSSNRVLHFLFFFFFNDTATTEIYTLSLHDALPILARRSGPSPWRRPRALRHGPRRWPPGACRARSGATTARSEEHTSELQSPCNLVCRLLLEKKKEKTLKATDDGVDRRAVSDRKDT